MFRFLFLLLLALVPTVTHGFDEGKYSKILERASQEYQEAHKLITQANQQRSDEQEKILQFLKNALQHCQKGSSECDRVLNYIAKRSSLTQQGLVCRKLKSECEERKKKISTQIRSLELAIHQVEGNLAEEAANVIYQKAVSKANEANANDRACQRTLSNVEEVVKVLEEAAKLYEEAVLLTREAFNFLTPYPSQKISQEILNQAIKTYLEWMEKCRKEATEWPTSVADQRKSFKEKAASLKEDSQLLAEKGLKRGSYDLQKQAVSLFEKLLAGSTSEELNDLKKELAELQISISVFEEELEKRLCLQSAPLFSEEEFRAREKQRKELFFQSDFLLNPQFFPLGLSVDPSLPRAIPLDGGLKKQEGAFFLFTEQFYRFLVQTSTAISEIFVTLQENGEVVHVETISLPFKNTQGWEGYLKNGMIWIPETKLKSEFGIDLRLSFSYDPKCQFSMILSQKVADPRYQLSISLDQKTFLYECYFSLPPPWQLGCLRKPSLTTKEVAAENSSLPDMQVIAKESGTESNPLKVIDCPILDRLVEELKNDPLAIAAYVQNEIAFADPILYQKNGVFYPMSIHRSPQTTYLEKQGSAWEQCYLLVYLLQKAGFDAVYAKADFCKLDKHFAEKLLFTHLREDQKNALVNYPWVVFFDGSKWVSLFPWMKEIQVHEGYDLYSLMPEEYATADRWVLRYLKGDENIIKHIGLDGDDTAGVLFVRFVEEQLKNRGLSLSDIGVQRVQVKKQFSSFDDFPHPSIEGPLEFYSSLELVPYVSARFAMTISSHENPKKFVSYELPVALLGNHLSTIHFTSASNNQHDLHFSIGNPLPFPLNLDRSDHVIDLTIDYTAIPGSKPLMYQCTFSIVKGTHCVLCLYFGGDNANLSSFLRGKFASEKESDRRLDYFLAFMGASYFEKCGRIDKILADLHKVNPGTSFAVGLSKFSPDLSKGGFRGEEDLSKPQVDMSWFTSNIQSASLPSIWHQEPYSAFAQYGALTSVDHSSNEHQILRDLFKDEQALSTVRLLQLAHQQHIRKGLEGDGFLQIYGGNFETSQAEIFGKQDFLKDLWKPDDPMSQWSYGYLTPGLIANPDGMHEERGALIFTPNRLTALISDNNLILNGGLGSPLPGSYFTPQSVQQWELAPSNKGQTLDAYTLQFSPDWRPSSILENEEKHPVIEPVPFYLQTWKDDVRPSHKNLYNSVADPVDVVTGAFYIDETDLILPGPFSLAIRRNYNSQNPISGHLGCGWKLGLNPFLIEEEEKRFAAELDGTVIVYRYNPQTSRWEVLAKDNPELSNFNQLGNPYHAYIENDILYGGDGSRRFFENGLLQKWIDASGNCLSFFYNEEQLSRIESSNGDFCGLHYSTEGRISEIYAKDGRRISYLYNAQGDLVKVTLPNTSTIVYEYDRAHRVIREIKPLGNVLENVYDQEGRVVQQKSPMGLQQEMIVTAAFDYADGVTTVTDACGGKTIYKIFQKQIFCIIDPMGFSTFQSWFIDEKSWFDAEREQIASWNKKGGLAKSLKSTTDKRGLTTHYFYDLKGNLERIQLEGEDLTGDGKSSIVKDFAYNERNLCIEENISETKTVFIYDETFPYLPKRIEKYSGPTKISHLELIYNAQGLVEKEDRSGSVTLWEYDSRGLPCKKTELTGTEDPNVITYYAHNLQGQCIEISSDCETRKNIYDLMGNLIESRTLSPSKSLLAATYIGYDLNNRPIWKQTANSENTIYFDYQASGLLKATRQHLSPSRSVAYSLYEYDPRGCLIEETDPRGYVTYRKYDAIGRVVSETKEDHTTLFTYEPGGLVQTITSPAGAKTTRCYTTNGLLKEEIFSDGTKNSATYDFFGRVILEMKNDISWKIQYDEVNRRIIRTQLHTKDTEISEFDERANLIRFTDAAGYTSEKTYDALNRIKTETSPSGKRTFWNYRDNLVICTSPNGEISTQHYEGDQVVLSEVMDSAKNLLSQTRFHYDPRTDVQQIVQGEEVTTTWMNALGLPLKIQKGDITTTYEYDFQGHCTYLVDGEGRAIRQKFDGLGRLSQKELSDGSLLSYIYDLDSRLIEFQLPNGSTWRTSYDSMGRKILEQLQASLQSCLRWEYIYENGYLKSSKDPLERIHSYLYEASGRLSQETVGGSNRIYRYDPRGLITYAEEYKEGSVSWPYSWVYGSDADHSIVLRSYDPDGLLSSETIHLNSKIIQETHQTWTPSSRILEVNGHKREFTYRNNQLAQVSSNQVNLTYDYNLSGRLKSKTTPWSKATIDRNLAGLPQNIQTHLPDGSCEENLNWYPSGKLLSYYSAAQQKTFTYTPQGFLQTAGSEKYDFAPLGVRTRAPDCNTTQNGLDPFGRIVSEQIHENEIITAYDQLGQVISQGEKEFTWDPWGRLIKVTDETSTWKASYDPFGRRLQTIYAPMNQEPLITTSFYDPEEEFREIGVHFQTQTFWKFYGPNSCDAVMDERKKSVYLMQDGLDRLTKIISSEETFDLDSSISSYGPQSPALPTDLLSYARSLVWHSLAQDPTGLIWMGARYYDPANGRFLSPDPIGYPISLDLYAYSNGDPINYLDPSGRFASPVYESTGPTVLKTGSMILNTWNNPQFQGALQVGFGFGEMAKAGTYIAATGGIGALAGGALLFFRGLDNVYTGVRQIISNQWVDSEKSQLLQAFGFSRHFAEKIDTALSLGSPRSISQTQSSLLGGLFKKSEEALQYTKSNLRLGQRIHKSYKAAIADKINLRKEYRLPSGRKIDFLDRTNGKVYELKPNNPRAIKAGMKQLEMYINELKTIPEYKNINWEGILEVY